MAEKKGIERFVRADLAAFGGYSAATSPDTLKGRVEVPVEAIIKLDANENPYGCSPRVGQALAAYPNVHVYPDDAQTELRALLAGYAGVGMEHIVAGNGSNQLIDLLLRLMLSPGDEVINCVPTFGIYHFSTELCGGKEIMVRRQADFSVDIPAVKAAITNKTRVIFLANPNNPSGGITPAPDIVALLETGLPVVVDEAYYEFSRQTVVPLMRRHENLIVLRTFSKWAGLAGLRIGYGLFPPRIAGYLLTIKVPYNVNVAAIVAVRESFKDMDYLMSNVQAIIAERPRLFAALSGLKSLKPVPSEANFILCAVLKGSAGELKARLEAQGILVRYFDQPLLNNYIRVSVGKPQHTDMLVRALKELGYE